MSAPADTKSLFVSLIKRWQCDLILDIGSMDGKQSLLFKDTLPAAKVVAFEANPKNYEKMAADPALRDRVTAIPKAVSDKDGTATFHIAEADYEKPYTHENNRGISSLLDRPGIKVASSTTVQTVRLDSFLKQPDYATFQRLAFWIDAESAEYLVLDGMRGIADRVCALHVEIVKNPERPGERGLADIQTLLAAMKFTLLASDLGPADNWGNVVFVRDSLLPDTRAAQRKAALTKALRVNQLADFLGRRCPPLYRLGRKAFLRSM